MANKHLFTSAARRLPAADMHNEAGGKAYRLEDEHALAQYAATGCLSTTSWSTYNKRNPEAKLVCIDIQPYAHTQAPERADILNVGGFSDAVFSLVGAFAEGRLHTDHWVHEIESIAL